MNGRTTLANFPFALVLPFLVLGCLFSSLFFGAPQAHAGTGLTIQPIKLSLTLKPGETATGTILLTNASDGDVTVDQTIDDFIPVANAEGLQFVGRAPGVTSVRDWITLGGSQSFSFKQGESREMQYVIKAPLDAEPGSHFGVLFYKASPVGPTGSLKVGTQVGVLVLVTVPGNHLAKGNILSFNAPNFSIGGPIHFSMRFQNTGTVYFEPKGMITITNMLGRDVGKVAIEGQVVLPTGAKDLNFDWPGDSLLFGQYKAVANVVDGEGNVLTSKQIVFYAAPVWYIAFLFAALIVLYILLKFVRRHITISVR